jgi:hypothetical protein
MAVNFLQKAGWVEDVLDRHRGWISKCESLR